MSSKKRSYEDDVTPATKLIRTDISPKVLFELIQDALDGSSSSSPESSSLLNERELANNFANINIQETTNDIFHSSREDNVKMMDYLKKIKWQFFAKELDTAQSIILQTFNKKICKIIDIDNQHFSAIRQHMETGKSLTVNNTTELVPYNSDIEMAIVQHQKQNIESQTIANIPRYFITQVFVNATEKLRKKEYQENLYGLHEKIKNSKNIFDTRFKLTETEFVSKPAYEQKRYVRIASHIWEIVSLYFKMYDMLQFETEISSIAINNQLNSNDINDFVNTLSNIINSQDFNNLAKTSNIKNNIIINDGCDSDVSL